MGVAFHEPLSSLCWDSGWLIFCRSCAASDSCCEFIWAIVLSCLANTVSCRHPLALALIIFLFPSSSMITEPCGERVWCSWPLRVSYSLLIYELWVFVLVALYCRKNLLWWGLGDVIIISGYEDNNLGGSLLLYPFGRIAVLGPMT